MSERHTWRSHRRAVAQQATTSRAKTSTPRAPTAVRGVTVRRFANAEARDITSFNRFSEWIFNYPHTERRRTRVAAPAGPVVPGARRLPRAASRRVRHPHLLHVSLRATVLGLRVAPGRSILVPTAHDEPAIHLGIYRNVFGAPAGMRVQHR